MSESVEPKKRSKIKQFFGQFAEPQFYVELTQTAIREVMRAAALALAGALTHHIQRRFSNYNIEHDFSNNGANNSNTSSQAASKAFGIQDTTDYRKPYTPSYFPSNPTASGGTFPGFGSR